MIIRVFKHLFSPIDNLYRLVRYLPIYLRFKAYTMVSWELYITNLELAETFKKVPGVIVECGTWKGGMIAGIAMVLGKERQYFLFDSFEGLPPAQEIDGQAALQWQTNTKSRNYHDNCTADEMDAKKAMQLSGAQDFTIVKGWFDKTLSAFDPAYRIAILRLDGDWYDSTLECLRRLFPYVAQGGIVIVDDYYTWDGCSRAIHDYLSENQRSERIHQFNNKVCYLIKK